MKTKTFSIIGNFLRPLEVILFNKFHAQQTKFISNNIDVAIREYKINYNNKSNTLEVFLIEDLLDDKTVIQSSDEKFIEELIREVKLIGTETHIINE